MKNDWLVTVRPRFGLAFDRALVYFTGGLAISNQRFHQSIYFYERDETVNALPPTGDSLGYNEGSVSDTRFGWTIGAGFEWAVNDSWSVKAEYLYARFGNQNFKSTYYDIYDNPWTVFHSVGSNNLSIARVGLNYRFGNSAAGPVVARY